MKVTAWTDEIKARENYIDLWEEKCSLLNKEKKLIHPDELKRQAVEKNIPYEDYFNQYFSEYEKIPSFTNEKRVNEINSLLIEMENTIVQCCRETGIRFTSDYHQYGEYGIPIIDDKYMFMTFARTWGRLMAEADYDYSDEGYLKYYLHGNKIKEVYPQKDVE